MANPTPLPTAVHIARGNPGHKKKADLDLDREPNTKPILKLPPAPEYLGEYGAREWYRSGPLLIENKLLHEGDLQVFEAYCLNVELMVQSQFAIKRDGMFPLGARGRVRNPAIAAFGQASTAIRGFAAEFGLTPAARSRIKLQPDDTDFLGDLGSGDEDDFSQGV